jgi:hypothetical protein
MHRGFAFLPIVFVIICRAMGADPVPPVHIDSPPPSTLIRSNFVGVAGRAASSTCYPAELDHEDLPPICADSGGHLTRLLQLSFGHHELLIAHQNIQLKMEPPDTKPASRVRWDLLQPGDILLSHSIGSEQGSLYDATYTHAAIYLGPGDDGTALFAEAVIEADAQGLGEVRTVPIESSLVYTRGQTVGIFRPASPVSPEQLGATLAFVRGVVNRGAHYWSADEDFSLLYNAWVLWDQKGGRPRNARRFQQVLYQLEARKFSTQRFTCAGLVWRAYWNGTNGKLDLADPNRARMGGRMANALSAAFLARVGPYFVSPDSLLLSGKLQEVRP